MYQSKNFIIGYRFSLLLSLLKNNYWPIDLMSRVFANGSGDRGSIPISSHTKDSKMVLDTSLLNTQHYKVRTVKLCYPGKGVVLPYILI